MSSKSQSDSLPFPLFSSGGELFRWLKKRYGALFFMLQKSKHFTRIYFSYPYSGDVKGNTEEIKRIVHDILDKTVGIKPMVPHFMYDALYDFPEGYTHEEFGLWEIDDIAHCDVFAYDPEHVSSGVRWEKCIAEMIQKPIMTFNEVKVRFAKK